MDSTRKRGLFACKALVARARHAIGASTLALCTASLQAAEAHLPEPTAIDTSVVSPTPLAQYAQVRIRIIDSSVLESKIDASVKRSWEAIFKAAKTVGAIEKTQWAQFNSQNSIVIPWTAKTSTRPKDVYSERILASLEGSVSSVADALQEAVIVNRGIPVGALNLGVLGTSKSVIPPAFRMKPNATTRSYSLLDKERFSSIDIGRTFSTTMARIGSTGLPSGPNVDLSLENRVHAAVPLTGSDFAPTPPLYSVNLKVNCKDLGKYRPLLAGGGAVLQYSGCDKLAEDLTEMSVQFDPPMSEQGHLTTVAASVAMPSAEPASAVTGNFAPMAPQGVTPTAAKVPKEWLTAVPSETAMAKLSKVLSRQPPASPQVPVPILVIIDDGFPSQAAYENTVKFFDEADTYFRKTFNIAKEWYADLPPAPQDYSALNAELAAPPQRTGAPRGMTGCPILEEDACRFHAKSIQKSLRLFTSLVGNRPQPVRVVWIPLFFAQPGAAFQAYRLQRFSTVAPDEYRGTGAAVKFEPAILEELQRQFFRELTDKGVLYPQSEADWKISRPYFDRILYYLRSYSFWSKTPVFINLSWRTRVDSAVSIRGRGESYTLLVAAAGNPCTPDVKCLGPTVVDKKLGRYNFLRYATDDPGAVIVANVSAEGTAICNTARLDHTRVGALAFQGGIQDDCGTSFAAPRMAWLLAANERYNPKVMGDSYLWADSLRRRVAPPRDVGACSFPDNMTCLIPQPEQLFPGLVQSTQP